MSYLGPNTVIYLTQALALWLLYRAIRGHRARRQFLADAILLDGEVTAIEEDNVDDVFWAQIAVTLPDGTPHQFRNEAASHQIRFKVGQRIKVYWNAAAEPNFLPQERFDVWAGIGGRYALAILAVLLSLLFRIG